MDDEHEVDELANVWWRQCLGTCIGHVVHKFIKPLRRRVSALRKVGLRKRPGFYHTEEWKVQRFLEWTG